MPVLPLCSVLPLLLSASVIAACQTLVVITCVLLWHLLSIHYLLWTCALRVCISMETQRCNIWKDTISLLKAIKAVLTFWTFFFFSDLNWLLKFLLCSIFYWLLKWIITFVHLNLFCAVVLPYRRATPTAARLSCLTAPQWRQEAKLEEVRILMKCQWGT